MPLAEHARGRAPPRRATPWRPSSSSVAPRRSAAAGRDGTSPRDPLHQLGPAPQRRQLGQQGGVRRGGAREAPPLDHVARGQRGAERGARALRHAAARPARRRSATRRPRRRGGRRRPAARRTSTSSASTSASAPGPPSPSSSTPAWRCSAGAGLPGAGGRNARARYDTRTGPGVVGHPGGDEAGDRDRQVGAQHQHAPGLVEEAERVAQAALLGAVEDVGVLEHRGHHLAVAERGEAGADGGLHLAQLAGLDRQDVLRRPRAAPRAAVPAGSVTEALDVGARPPGGARRCARSRGRSGRRCRSRSCPSRRGSR